MSDNQRRAQRAYAALRDYVIAKGEIFEESSAEIVDLITDSFLLSGETDVRLFRKGRVNLRNSESAKSHFVGCLTL
jgi:hypothetical protein